MNEKTKEICQYILGALIVLCFFGVIVLKMALETAADDVLNTLVGVLGTMTVMVVTFFFGSSKGSSDKTKMLTKKE